MARRLASVESSPLRKSSLAFGALPVLLASQGFRSSFVPLSCMQKASRAPATVVPGTGPARASTFSSGRRHRRRGVEENQAQEARAERASSGTPHAGPPPKSVQVRKKGSAQSRERSERTPVRGPLSQAGATTPPIQWYPGHIAKAERTLRDSLKLVDVVIEVRDCRIPIATAHPEVASWVGSRPRVLAMNRTDLVPDVARAAWRQYFTSCGEVPRFINAKEGRGVRELKKLALAAGSAANEKRKRKGLLPRPVRCVVIGYPNVGKSALINRLVGKRAAKSSNKPGVTRNFQWVRISDSIELLDMPGVIPAKLVSQDTALRLAVCDDIGQAAYDSQIIAGLLVEELKRVDSHFPGYADLSTLEERFKVDPRSVSGEEFLYVAAERLYKGDTERTARRLLTEFRSGSLGPVALEAPEMLLHPVKDVITKRS